MYSNSCNSNQCSCWTHCHIISLHGISRIWNSWNELPKQNLNIFRRSLNICHGVSVIRVLQVSHPPCFECWLSQTEKPHVLIASSDKSRKNRSAASNLHVESNRDKETRCALSKGNAARQGVLLSVYFFLPRHESELKTKHSACDLWRSHGPQFVHYGIWSLT